VNYKTKTSLKRRQIDKFDRAFKMAKCAKITLAGLLVQTLIGNA